MDIASISAVVAAGGVLVGVFLAIMEVRSLVKAREADLVTELHMAFLSEDWQRVWFKTMSLEFREYRDFVKKHGLPTWENMLNKPAYMQINRTGGFFEALGILLSRGLVDINLVSNFFPISLTWEKMKPFVEGQRKERNRPHMMEWFEYLYHAEQKLLAQQQ